LPDDVEAFTEFVKQVEPRLRISLMAALGAERGREGAAELPPTDEVSMLELAPGAPGDFQSEFVRRFWANNATQR
jgi:hypothetical protein